MTDSNVSARPFTVPDFRYFWTARLCSTLAQSGLVVIIGWQVYNLSRLSMDIKRAALQLGLIGLAQFLPLFALALVAGVAADRLDRRRIVQCCNALQFLAAALLTALNITGAISLAWLFTVAVMLGIARAFSMPALGAMAPNLVPRPMVPRAIAASSIATRAGAILGPALAGYLYAAAPYQAYAVNALLLAISIASLARLHPVRVARAENRRMSFNLVFEGITYVRHNRLVLGAISLDLFAVLLGGATAMLPIYAQDILHVGPSGLGHLRAAPAAGALLSASWFSWRPLEHHVGVKMLAAVSIFGLATAVFGLSRSMVVSLPCLFILGAADMLSVYVRQSLIQISTPDEMRGRVAAVSSIFVSASNELGEAESGFLAALVGPVTAVVAGGLGAIAIAGIWARLFPMLREAKTFDLPVIGADQTGSPSM
ncbi:MFS transporter [Sphingomonas oryzagri]|uniref:MFS transporter n=1 Tax=Sphingomonas oryzagri TaxID=3042314 RepID=A0ABT6N3H6_9SPHN|nr:MFS transporter [Sphingomonas oryzagri]MDH7639319.1 MFS transporter [Sphingomonas oryzagri]